MKKILVERSIHFPHPEQTHDQNGNQVACQHDKFIVLSYSDVIAHALNS